MLEKNRQKFLDIKALHLPIGEYAITGSGPLGIRNLREINDIDIIVSSTLWDALSEKYGVIDTGVIKKIIFPRGIIEAMGENSFYSVPHDAFAPLISERILHADIIEGLPFESLEHVLYYKRKMGREKDLQDIRIIKAWQHRGQ